jgi:hypothetical protein
MRGRASRRWSILLSPADRYGLLVEGWKEVVKVFVMATLIDVAYQVMVLRWFYPAEALFVAFLLAFLPYLAVRSLVDRFARARAGLFAAGRARVP